MFGFIKPSCWLLLIIRVSLISGILTLAFSIGSAFALDTTFRVRANIKLCPDYSFGNIGIELKYRLPNETDYRNLNVVSQSINNFNQTGTFEFLLPADLGKTSLSVAAFCRNNAGVSRASNEVSISYCDLLKVRDRDLDGRPDADEDTNCNGYFDPADSSNLYNVDTDGDGVRDQVEALEGSDPTNPGSSKRAYVYLGSPFDADGDGRSNAVVFRPSNGTWYVRDFVNAGNNVSFPFGKLGDIPIGYNPMGATSDVGVIRTSGTNLQWLLRGQGFARSNSTRENSILFGVFGDNIILGPWEVPGVTSPAVARIFNDQWSFDIYLRDGTVRSVNFGTNGDVPRVQDYDGDGIFDVAVFRPSTLRTYVLRSSDGTTGSYLFGTGTADLTVRGDYNNDGTDDIAFWEPISAKFFTLNSSITGFNDALAAIMQFPTYSELNLGTYLTTVPLSWNRQNGRIVYTVVNHSTGVRSYFLSNSTLNPLTQIQWGIAGDAQG